MIGAEKREDMVAGGDEEGGFFMGDVFEEPMLKLMQFIRIFILVTVNTRIMILWRKKIFEDCLCLRNMFLENQKFLK